MLLLRLGWAAGDGQWLWLLGVSGDAIESGQRMAGRGRMERSNELGKRERKGPPASPAQRF